MLVTCLPTFISVGPIKALRERISEILPIRNGMCTHLSRWFGVHDASELSLVALPRVDPASLHFDLRRICTTEWISVTRVDAGGRA